MLFERSFEMKSQLLVFLVMFVVHCVWDAESAPAVAKSRQFIPPMPGYIPVYIRPGNTPLEEINLDLAEAFKSYAYKQGRLESVRSLTLANNVLIADEEKNENDISNISLEDKTRNSDKHAVIIHQHQIQHIQKIPTKLTKKT